jgi:hypothetical protein
MIDLALLAARRGAPVPAWLRVLLAPLVAAVTVVGVWFFAGVVTNDFELSMALTALWFGVAGVIALAVSWRRRQLLLPVLGTFILTAGVVGGYLAYTTLIGKTVNEQVAIAQPASAVPPGARVNVQLARGSFSGIAHGTSGEAALVRLASGRKVVQLLDFETSAGPDLRVYLVAGPVDADGDPGEHEDLGALKGNRGTQQYEIPADVDTGRYSSVLIWCRAFSVPFGSAPLVPS